MKKTKASKGKKKATNAKSKTAKQTKVAKEPEETVDRPTLIGITRLLKGAGADVKALKKDTDDALQKKVNEALQQLPSAEVVKLLEAVDPEKLVNVLKLDCVGIFIDLSDVSCTHCPDVKVCAEKFINNVRAGFVSIKGALAGGKHDATAKVAPAPAPVVVPVTRYQPKRTVFIRDVPNPNPKGDDYHDTIQRILDDQPETLYKLRAIVERDFTLDGDGDFMKFVTALRDPKDGVIKLDVDLDDEDKAALREAGYDV